MTWPNCSSPLPGHGFCLHGGTRKAPTASAASVAPGQLVPRNANPPAPRSSAESLDVCPAERAASKRQPTRSTLQRGPPPARDILMRGAYPQRSTHPSSQQGAETAAARTSRTTEALSRVKIDAFPKTPLHVRSSPSPATPPMPLTSAHRGYEYQDLLVAARLVDVMVGAIVEIRVDDKLFQNDVFDDLTTIDTAGCRERTQIKYTSSGDHPLALATFTGDGRSLRLDRVIATALADRDGPGAHARDLSFRIVMRDTPPTDRHLLAVLEPADPDPGPLVPGMNTRRMRFRPDSLWNGHRPSAPNLPHAPNPFIFLRLGAAAVQRSDLHWVCQRLVLELAAPAASLDLTNPRAAEQLLLHRVQDDVGAGAYPNVDRSAIDVAEALIRRARAARQRSMTVTPTELLRRTQLRSDFGAVARANPVDTTLEVPRFATVTTLAQHLSTAADDGRMVLLVGPPGQGKSWICQQLIDRLSANQWLVAEHFCYLGEADSYRLPRVRAESVFGSLLRRLAEHDPDLVADQRPRFAADERALENAIREALRKKPNGRVALVVDGIDHITRVNPGNSLPDPSLLLADALAGLALPPRTALLVLSQPGQHLQPLEAVGALTLQMPSMTDSELRQLAIHSRVIDGTSNLRHRSPRSPLLLDQDATEDFLAALSDQSAGNALYATYLCREALRSPTTLAGPAAAVRGLPPFDGSLLRYYQHIHASLGQQGAWVADVIALLDCPVSRGDLKHIRPDMAHRVDTAFDVLRPVLLERATQGGARIYHESFARFLRLPFQHDPSARTALLDRIIAWLERKGMFNDSRAFRHLLRTLADANYDQKAVRAVNRDFVVKSIAAGFPASAIVENLATAVRCAARIADWPAVARYVEMTRSAATYQEERFESAIVGFVDVLASLLGVETLADRLLHDGRPIMAARHGLQMCAALDRLGAVAPWREYMTAFLRESENDNTLYGEASDLQIDAAWLRGRLRLASLHHSATADNDNASAFLGADDGRALHAPLDWERLAEHLNARRLAPADVIQAIIDTYGLPRVIALLPKLAQSGDFCLALAEQVSAHTIPDAEGDALYWASRAATCSVSPGKVPRLVAFGLQVDTVDQRPVAEAREHLLELTRHVSTTCREAGQVDSWLDACALAARRDSLGLATAEALLSGPGWYTSWLRFTVALARAEANTPSARSAAAVEALQILTEIQNPFLGDPRACDLYPIHGTIRDTIRRALSLLDDQAWGHGLEILDRVSNVVSTTIRGELGGPLPRDLLLHFAVDSATFARRNAAEALVKKEIEHGGAGRYYSDLAEYRLLAARLALVANDPAEARRHWTDACRLLVGYGWHKDTTVYEILDPLPMLIALDPGRGRAAVAKIQPLCERVPQHTDGKGTRHVWSHWWRLLASADPCALARLVQPRLLSTCNDPNSLLHGARLDLWSKWYERADPFLAAALRLTLDIPLHEADISALRSLLASRNAVGEPCLSRLLVALLARIDERPPEHDYSDSNDLLDRDRSRVNELNAIAERAGAPTIGPLPPPPPKRKDPDPLLHPRPSAPSPPYLPERIAAMFRPGALGAAEAIRAWRRRRYDETRPGWSVGRFSNCLGYRLVELLDAGRVRDAEISLRLIPDLRGIDDSPLLLKALAEGLERHGRRRLATIAYTLAWTCTRGGGGWTTFGGETEAESLRRAAALHRPLVLETIATEIERLVSANGAMNGIGQALMYGFARADLHTDCSVAFDIWNEVFAAIDDRTPRVAAADDPDDLYQIPDPDSGEDSPGDLDAAFAGATVAALAHPGREQKRRSLLATELIIAERPATAASVLQSALLSLSDVATLTWLLRAIEQRSDTTSIVSACRSSLAELTQRPHLTVRTLARRLLAGSEPPLAAPSEPDPELLPRPHAAVWLPDSDNAGSPDSPTLKASRLVEGAAGVRLSRAESQLPGLRRAVVRRVTEAQQAEAFRHRMDRQMRAYADQARKRWPDVFLASIESVEDAMQRAAAGIRGARLMNGQPVTDPGDLEDSLAYLLLDDPELPLALERTRHPRPEMPPPPPRGDSLWSQLSARADGRAVEDTRVEAASHADDGLRGTLAILPPHAVPTVAGGPYDNWRLVGTIERRVLPSQDFRGDDDITFRHRAIELRVPGDRHALDLPPFASATVELWRRSRNPHHSAVLGHTRAAIGCDSAVRAAADGHLGLGIHTHLLAPAPWVLSALHLRPSRPFVLDDDLGPAAALISWRTEYATSDYYLAWPRLCGTGLLLRNDALAHLIELAHDKLTYRDFLTGSLGLTQELQ